MNSTDGAKVLVRNRKDRMVAWISKTSHDSPG